MLRRLWQAVRSFRSASGMLQEHRRRYAPKRCLVVDDSAANQVLLRALLTQAGHAVTTASNGAAALRAIENDAIDVVFLDLHMPVMSGVDVLRQRPVGSPPIIVVSSESDPVRIAEVMQAGAIAFVPKPYGVNGVLDSLALAVEKRRQVPPSAAPVPVSCTLVEMREWDDAASIRTFLGHVVAEMTQGLASIERALRTGDRAQAAQQVHAIKNNVASIGNADAVRLSVRLEEALLGNGEFDDLLPVFRSAIADAVAWIQRQPEVGGR